MPKIVIRPATIYDRVRMYLKAKGGFATLREIADGAEVDENAARTVLYRTHPGRFLRLPKLKGRRVAWKLAEGT